MRRKTAVMFFLVLIFLGCPFILCAQADTLLSSIGYTPREGDSKYGRKIERSVITRKPVELKDAGLLYIEIERIDTYGNTGLLGPYSEKINSKLLKKMNKKYPYRFDSYPNEYKYKGKEFFIQQGYQYRLIIVSSVEQTTSFDKSVMKQYFTVGIEDLDTGKIYLTGKSTEHPSYIKKFIKTLEE